MDDGDRRLLEVLDDTPSTVTGLARRLERPEEEVEEGLSRLEAEGLAVDWGAMWATTWRAKLKLSPGFFEVWLPASVGVAAGATALAVVLHGPSSLPAWLAPALAVVAVLGLARGLVPVVAGDEATS